MRKLSCLIALLVINVSLAFAQNVQYSYDALGRLAGVVDQNGNAAQYAYDANGNITGITRYTSAQIAILSFTPASGPPGTTVTITGINLVSGSTAPAVAFNGTAAASPSPFSANQLVVQVPSGASSGLITVTTSGGTASSATSFTVTSLNSGPQITGISPVIGDLGGAVTLTGLSFSTPASADQLSLNGIAVPAQTATSTTIGFTIPSQLGSGHLSLVTPLGYTTSSGDLYVPPPPFTSSQVTSSQRLTIGTPYTASPQNPGDIAMLLFDGKESKKASILLQNSTFPGACYSSIVSIVKPDGTQGPSGQLCGQGTGFLDAFLLTESGTYAAVIAPQSGIGSADVTAYEFSDITGAMSMGSQTPIAITSPGQNAELSFTGTSGQLVNIWVAGSTISACYSLNFRLLGTDGSQLGSTDLCFQSSAGFSEVVLPSTGMYTAVVDPYGPLTGSANVVLSTDVSGAITSGVDQPITISLPGQSARYTINATAGQQGSLVLANSTFPGSCYSVAISILNPNGSQLTSTNMCGQGSTFLDEFTFSTTGTYTVLVSPQNGGTGTADLTVYQFQDVSGSMSVNSSSNITTTYPGQNAVLTFSGTAGAQVNVAVSNVTYSGCYSINFRVLNPDGSQLASTNLCFQSGASFSNLTLPSTGAYTIVVDPQGTLTGSATVTLSSNVTGSITPGTATAVNLSVAGQTALLTFTATAGQLGSVLLSSSTFSGCPSVALTVLNPDGSQLATTNMCGTGTGFLDQFTFPTTGTYTVTIGPQGGATGTANVTVYEFSNITSSTSSGSPTTVVITAPGQNATVTFTGTAGQPVNVWVTGVTIPGCYSMNLAVYNPDGSQLAGQLLCLQGSAGFADLALGQTGTYSVFIDPQGPSTGSATVDLSTDVTGSITPGVSDPVSIGTPGQNAQLTFSGTAGQQATVSMTDATFSGGCYTAALALLAPDGSTQTSASMCGTGSLSLSTVTLPSTGTYTILLSPQNGYTGTANVEVTLE